MFIFEKENPKVKNPRTPSCSLCQWVVLLPLMLPIWLLARMLLLLVPTLLSRFWCIIHHSNGARQGLLQGLMLCTTSEWSITSTSRELSEHSLPRCKQTT